MSKWQKLRRWIIENFEEKNETKAEDLVWLDRKLDNKNKLDWSNVDTVDFDIESIPKKRELIIDVGIKPKEVGRKWQLLNTGK